MASEYCAKCETHYPPSVGCECVQKAQRTQPTYARCAKCGARHSVTTECPVRGSSSQGHTRGMSGGRFCPQCMTEYWPGMACKCAVTRDNFLRGAPKDLTPQVSTTTDSDVLADLLKRVEALEAGGKSAEYQSAYKDGFDLAFESMEASLTSLMRNRRADSEAGMMLARVAGVLDAVRKLV